MFKLSLARGILWLKGLLSPSGPPDTGVGLPQPITESEMLWSPESGDERLEAC